MTPHFISLGAGVQSSVMALMAAAGELTPMPIGAVFANTKHEPKAVYEWLRWLTPRLPFPVYRVSRGDLWASATTVRTTRDGERTYIQTGIPIYFLTEDGDGAVRRGIGRRACTRDFKIAVLHRKVKRLLGVKRVPKDSPCLAEMWVGISLDEAQRAKASTNSWLRLRYPLLEQQMSREDCLDWMADRKLPPPPRSACTFCPFRSDESWLALTPEERTDVARKEKELQRAYAKASAVKGIPYFHASRVPFEQVKFDNSIKQKFSPECEGMCGR